MRHRRPFTFFLALLVISWATSSIAQEIRAMFSPHGGIASAIRAELDKSTKNIYCQAYHLSSQQIIASFISARRRGIPCNIIVDASQPKTNYEFLNQLRLAGCHILVDRAHRINHNKVIIIDDAMLITGSYNFSNTAETHNAESILFLQHQPTIDAFKADWFKHALHSKPLTDIPSFQPRRLPTPHRPH